MQNRYSFSVVGQYGHYKSRWFVDERVNNIHFSTPKQKYLDNSLRCLQQHLRELVSTPCYLLKPSFNSILYSVRTDLYNSPRHIRCRGPIETRSFRKDYIYYRSFQGYWMRTLSRLCASWSVADHHCSAFYSRFERHRESHAGCRHAFDNDYSLRFGHHR